MSIKRKQKIAWSFLRWLLLLTLIAFVVTTAFLWVFQTDFSNKNAENLLRLNISDVKADIKDATDEHLLEITRSVAKDFDGIDADSENHANLNRKIDNILKRYDIAEVNIINSKGIIVASNFKDFWDYDMASGKQSGEFMVLLRGEKELVQKYQPVSYDASIQRKYAGVILKNGGFVQVGYDFEHFQKTIDREVVSLTRNRHVGNNGRILICDKNGNIVSNVKGINRKKLDLRSFGLKNNTVILGQRFRVSVDGEKFYGMAEISEGYYIIAIIPEKEIIHTRNMVVSITVIAEIIILAILVAFIFVLIKKQIVNSVHKINYSLSEISGGNLDVTVNVRNNREFDSLSDDINATVDTLKKYIADAAARIDAELAFAKAIQVSSLPSVFPPYPNRMEFDVFASMHTAKEVGGDFYDFYFVDDDNLAFMVADVSGKGIPAAMFMMTSKTIIKSFVESGMSVEEAFTRANQKLCEGNDAGMFVTAWMGILNIKTGKVTFANAGHNPPLVKHGEGTFEYLKSRAGFVLAGMEGIRYRKNELELSPGDIIYLYTDGVTEAADADNNLYGEDRLHNILEKHKHSSPEILCDEIIKDVNSFAGETPQFDDITMLCLKYNGATPEGEEAK